MANRAYFQSRALYIVAASGIAGLLFLQAGVPAAPAPTDLFLRGYSAIPSPRKVMLAVCSGFVYALAVADRMVAGGLARNALVVGAEIYSRILDWNDRGSCVLFGDGAGAVVLEPAHVPGDRFRAPARRRTSSRTSVRAGVD